MLGSHMRICQLSLNKKKQHVFDVLDVKPVKIAFNEFIQLVIISTNSDPIQMLVIMPFDYLKLYDSNDSAFGVDNLSRFPVSSKSIELLSFSPPMLYVMITDEENYTQSPTDPHPRQHQKHSLAATKKNNEKALNIFLWVAIPDRHHHRFYHDATNAKTLWTAIKARFGGNEASKKMQKNLLKQQFETFTIGSREELDSAYERFQNILSMLELYDAKVSLEDANLKFLRSLPSVWHVVATMIRGQPGLDELEFDDLYNNLKVYEHELKGVSNSNSQNIAFLSTEVKGSTLKQSTVEPAHIPKGYTQAASSTVQTAPNCASHSDEIICSFFAQQASMPTTHDDEDLLQIDEDAMEEIDIPTGNGYDNCKDKEV
ncbi:hypothetical protein Tco_1369462 [Tanacetum coccineum]